MSATRLNEPDKFVLIMPSGSPYIDRQGRSEWTLDAAKAVARNVAMKNKCVVKVTKIEDLPLDTYDRVLSYVDSLKGKALTKELKYRDLPVGSDPVASKRERLISHLLKYGI